MGRLSLGSLRTLLIPETNQQGPNRSALLTRFGLAVLGPVAALGISLLLRPIFEPNPYLVAWLGITVATWYGGLTAAVLTLLLFELFFYPPDYTITFDVAFLVRAAVVILT